MRQGWAFVSSMGVCFRVFQVLFINFNTISGDQVAKQLEAEDDDDLEEQRQEQGGTEEPESIDVFVCVYMF
jgi:hypothetical protein